MVTGAELKRLFDIAFDEATWRSLAHHIHDGYADAVDRVSTVDKEFQRRAIPQIRHYIIQSRIRHVATKHREIAATIDYSEDGSEPYTVLASDNFYLSVSMVHCPGQLPRHSHFRQANATDNLFTTVDPKDVDRFYAILSHVPSWNNARPQHLAILFPDDAYSGVFEYINLDALIDFDLEPLEAMNESIDVPEPKLRKRIPKKKEA